MCPLMFTKRAMHAINLSPFQRAAVLASLILAVLMLTIDSTIANVAIPYIAGDLAVSYTHGTYLTTLFAVGNAITLLVSGRLSEKFGAIKTFLFSLALFTCFSTLCGLSTNYNLLVFFRFLQGVSAGPLIPVGQSILFATHPKEKRDNALTLWAIVIMLGPILGPILGGVIADNFSWSWIFYINIPIGLLSFFLFWVFLKEHAQGGVKTRFDFPGLFLLSLCVTALQLLLNKGQEWDWLSSSRIRLLAIIFSLSLFYLLFWLKRFSKPIVDLSLYKNRSFSLSLILTAITMGTYVGILGLIPRFLETSMGYDATYAGLSIAPISLVPLLFERFVAKLLNRFSKLLLLFICFSIFSAACFYTAFLATTVDLYRIWFSLLLIGLALTFFFLPMLCLMLQDVENKDLGMANAIFHFHRIHAIGVGSSLFATLWARRTTFHYERISTSIREIETTIYFSPLKELHLSKNRQLELLSSEVSKQAAMMGINDCFWVMGSIFVLLILLLPIGIKRKSRTNLPV